MPAFCDFGFAPPSVAGRSAARNSGSHALTYSVVPLPLRVLWVDVLEIVWVAILSTAVASTGQPQLPCDFSSCDNLPKAEEALRDGVDVPTVAGA